MLYDATGLTPDKRVPDGHSEHECAKRVARLRSRSKPGYRRWARDRYTHIVDVCTVCVCVCVTVLCCYHLTIVSFPPTAWASTFQARRATQGVVEQCCRGLQHVCSLAPSLPH